MTELKKGDQAPYFQGETDDHGTVSLDDYADELLVLYFYPKDNTPGCNKQACNIRDNYKELQNKNINIIGVSPDSIRKHKNFRNKFDLPFPLISDPDKKILNDYGVWGEKKFMGRTYDGVHRTTFIIDGDGKIKDIIKKVKTKDHTTQILKSIEEN